MDALSRGLDPEQHARKHSVRAGQQQMPAGLRLEAGRIGKGARRGLRGVPQLPANVSRVDEPDRDGAGGVRRAKIAVMGGGPLDGCQLARPHCALSCGLQRPINQSVSVNALLRMRAARGFSAGRRSLSHDASPYPAPRLACFDSSACVLAVSLGGCHDTILRRPWRAHGSGLFATSTGVRRPPRNRRGVAARGEGLRRALPQRTRTTPTPAIRYAQALRRPASARKPSRCCEQASIHNPASQKCSAPTAARLPTPAQFEQALDVLGRAHTPDQPDWRILSAQGAVLDQMGRHEEARRYYDDALKIVPDEPSVLSNLGLSYALVEESAEGRGDLAARQRRQSREPRVRQNLALVVGLQGRFQEAEQIARADLPPEEAAANVAYLKQMLAQQNTEAAAAAQQPPQRRVRASAARAIGASAIRQSPRRWSSRLHERLTHDASLLQRHDADRGRAENDDEQHRQEEQDHRHRQLRRQRRGLLLGFRHAHVAIFLRHHAQRLAERRAVAFRLLQARRRPT